MSAISDLRLTIRSEISSLVAMSCLRSAMRFERSGVVAVGGSTSVSILLKVRVSMIDAISVFICSTVSVSMVRRA